MTVAGVQNFEVVANGKLWRRCDTAAEADGEAAKLRSFGWPAFARDRRGARHARPPYPELFTDRATEAQRSAYYHASQTHDKDTDMPTSIEEMVDSRYTKKEDVGDGTLVTFRSFKKANVALDSDEEQVRIVATFDELKKPVVLNRTNLKKMAKLLGSTMIDDWVGKQVVLFNDETVVYAGEEVGGIRVRAAPKKAAAWKAPQNEDADFADDIPQ